MRAFYIVNFRMNDEILKIKGSGNDSIHLQFHNKGCIVLF